MHHFADSDPNVYRDILGELRRKYTGATLPALRGIARIAVHMRRGDVSESSNAERFATTESMVAIIERITAEVSARGLQPNIALYSQGVPHDFAALTERFQIDLQINQDPIWTMERLIESEVLVMAKSSFSYVAALLNRGAVYYQPFWHKPMSHWTKL